MVSNETITIKPNQVIEIAYFNSYIDGLNNLTIKINENRITVTSYDDCLNEFDVKVITIDQLLTLANKKFNALMKKKHKLF
tara:strand:+ start:1807 stop:2049 length:243 start_codon:yes stop_codon:yes gene_type:complete